MSPNPDKTALPCPLCGVQMHDHQDEGAHEHPESRTCILGSFYVPAWATEQWNTRVSTLQGPVGNSSLPCWLAFLPSDMDWLEDHGRKMGPGVGQQAVERLLVALRHIGGSLPPVAIPDGFVLVPVEPTPDMDRAGANTFGGQGDNVDARYECAVMYRAMLAAAPPVQATSKGGVEPSGDCEAPGHTDLMVSPESIDAFLEANPLPLALQEGINDLGSNLWWGVRRIYGTNTYALTNEDRHALSAALFPQTAGAGDRPVKTTMTLSLTDEEMAVLEKLAAEQDLKPPTVFRQALRVYQLYSLPEGHPERIGRAPSYGADRLALPVGEDLWERGARLVNKLTYINTGETVLLADGDWDKLTENDRMQCYRAADAILALVSQDQWRPTTEALAEWLYHDECQISEGWFWGDMIVNPNRTAQDYVERYRAKAERLLTTCALPAPPSSKLEG